MAITGVVIVVAAVSIFAIIRARPIDTNSLAGLTWVEIYPIACVENLCRISWLQDYYNSSTLIREPVMGNLQGSDFDHTSTFLTDYYGKRGVIIRAVSYVFVNPTLCEKGECYDTYALELLVAKDNVDEMLQAGYQLSEKPYQRG